MRNWTMAILPLAIVMTASGCSAEVTSGDRDGKSEKRPVESGPITTQSFGLSGFTGIEVTGPDDVTVRRGDSFSIVAKGPKNEIDELEIVRDGDVLSIGRKREGFSFSSHDSDGVQIAITMPKLDSVRLTGSGSIDADSVDGDAVEAVLTGSGDLKAAKLSGKTAKITISGSGDVEIGGGTIASGNYDITGSGNIDADGLVADTLDISITGSGDVDAQATGSADVRILGSGDANISGGGKCSTRALGSGTATCK